MNRFASLAMVLLLALGSASFSMGGGSNLVVYPNPVQGTLRGQLELSGSQPVSLSLYDMLGRRVEAKNLPSSQRQFAWEVGHLPAGMYWLKAEQGDAVVAQVRVVLAKS
ncbi:MAG: T9SS type A sorting domain-containing protein [Schleiferiaceae bacterium]|jgi:hypothetical protein